MCNIQKQLSVYIHFPWCIKKCPYCDFNSHAIKDDLYLSNIYYKKLIADFDSHLEDIQDRKITSIFIGGGTPSLFKAEYLNIVLEHIKKNGNGVNDCEVTLEMNPGTVERGTISSYQDIGINRISLGVQSFQDDKLKSLGRIHNCDSVYTTIDEIKKSQISNFNLDIMHGLPNQTVEDGVFDISQAISLQSTHISWYQLTIEPNTLFAAKPPILPNEDTLETIETLGKKLLTKAGYHQYEVSAYAKNNYKSKHNNNYWMFGDYIGIGAGAHSKISNLNTQEVKRIWKHKHPKIYTHGSSFIKDYTVVSKKELIYEFMLNVLRLRNGFNTELFKQQTFLDIESVQKNIQAGVDRGLLEVSPNKGIKPTKRGYLFLNDCINLFI